MMAAMTVAALHHDEVVAIAGRCHRSEGHRRRRRDQPNHAQSSCGNQQAFHDQFLLQRLCANDNIRTRRTFQIGKKMQPVADSNFDRRFYGGL